MKNIAIMELIVQTKMEEAKDRVFIVRDAGGAGLHSLLYLS